MPGFGVAFWNVSNLFRPGVVSRGPQSDEEVTAKIGVVATVIDALFDGRGPDLLGLAEVNGADLLARIQGALSADYLPLWSEPGMSDQTGLALLGRQGAVSDLELVDEQRPTMLSRPRCLLARCALAHAAEPVLVGLNHWKSRMKHGNVDDEAERRETARWLGDYLASSTRDTCVIVMGDFNAEPFEGPFREVGLRGVRFFSTALWSGATPAYLYNTAWRFLCEAAPWERARQDDYSEPRPKMTHDSSPPVVWDQLLVSARALRGGPVELREATVSYHCDSVTSRRTTRGTPKGVLKPARWEYRGAGDYSGASDHFPLVAVFDTG
jgi:endonuclease/exonuclease/phosphatase family metal-dependent hydrolase